MSRNGDELLEGSFINRSVIFEIHFAVVTKETETLGSIAVIVEHYAQTIRSQFSKLRRIQRSRENVIDDRFQRELAAGLRLRHQAVDYLSHPVPRCILNACGDEARLQQHLLAINIATQPERAATRWRFGFEKEASC